MFPADEICTPATFPLKPPITEPDLPASISSDFIVVAAYPKVFSLRFIPNAVTTTSSNTSASLFRTTCIGVFFIATSLLFIPTNETIKVLLSAFTPEIIKLPSTSVMVPWVVPFTNTEAPTIGNPSSSEVTTPFTVTPCDHATPVHTNSRASINVSFLFINPSFD